MHSSHTTQSTQSNHSAKFASLVSRNAILSNVAESAASRAALDGRSHAATMLRRVSAAVSRHSMNPFDAYRVILQYRTPIQTRFQAWRSQRSAMSAFSSAATVCALFALFLFAVVSPASAKDSSGSSSGWSTSAGGASFANASHNPTQAVHIRKSVTAHHSASASSPHVAGVSFKPRKHSTEAK